MSDWLPVACSTCGRTVAAAPPGRAPVLVVCGACSPGLVAAALRAPATLEPELRRELYQPVQKAKGYR
jgi:hypothetical protein